MSGTPSELDQAVVAAYRDDVPPMYRGNPFIEALPQFTSPEQILKELSRRPKFDPAWRECNDMQRLQSLPSIKTVYEPLNRDVDGFVRLYSEMLASYAGRDAGDPHYFLKVARQLGEDPPEILTNSHNGYAAPTIARIGLPGSGKSVSISRWMSLIPRVIRHEYYHGRPFFTHQVPWVMVNCPSDASPKTLCQGIYQHLDALLNTRYCARYKRSGRSVGDMLQDVARLAALHGIALFIIDNVENLSVQTSGGTAHLRDFLFNLAQDTRSVVVLVGTYEAEALINKSFRQARRTVELGGSYWERLTGNDWERCLRAQWEILYTRDPTELSSALIEVITRHTAGIPGLSWALLRFAQERAITLRGRLGHERITPDLVESVAKDEFAIIQSALSQIRTGAPEGNLRFPDIHPILAKANTPTGRAVEPANHIPADAPETAGVNSTKGPASSKKPNKSTDTSNTNKDTPRTDPLGVSDAKDTNVYDQLAADGHIATDFVDGAS